MDLDASSKEKLRQIVVDSLLGMGGRLRNEEILILCPFHDDSRPSLHVHIGHKLSPGTYHCFVCNAKGGWFSLAKRLNLDTGHIEILKIETKTSKIENPFSVFIENIKEINTNRKEISIDEPPGLEQLDPGFSWRGLSEDLLKKLEAKMHWQKKSANYWLYLPLRMNRRLEGYTLCALKKEPNTPKYLLFGEARRILYPYDFIQKNKKICLVEGHFDALRLVDYGISTMCIFGVNNWSETKKSSLLAKMPKKVFLLMDGDPAGRTAATKIHEDLKFGAPVEIVHLPDPEPDQERFDPGNMPISWIESLKDYIENDKV
jgi:hypothetical protein